MKKSLLPLLIMAPFALKPLYASGIVEMSQYRLANDQVGASEAFDSFVEFSTRRNLKEGTGVSYQYDFGVRKYNNSTSPIFALSEAFLSYKRESSSVSLGRKKLGWNPAATHWTMGQVYSSRGFNLARDYEEGTTGLHLKKKWGRFFAQAVFSTVFVPQLNPGVEILGGNIEAKSEWSNLPPDRVRFEGQNIPIIYNVEMPSVSEFINQRTFAGALGYEGRRDAIVLHAGRKPEPGARVNAAGFLDLNEGGRVFVNAKPFVNLQNFYGVSWNRQWNKRFSTAIDYQYIAPERGIDSSFVFEGFRVEPKYTNISYGSFSADWRGDFLSVKLMGIRAFKTYELSDATFEKKLPWENALGLDVNWQVMDRWGVGMRIKNDLERSDTVLTSYTRFQLSKKLAANVYYQDINSPDDRSFWSVYRGNDIWEFNLQYLF